MHRGAKRSALAPIFRFDFFINLCVDIKNIPDKITSENISPSPI